MNIDKTIHETWEGLRKHGSSLYVTYYSVYLDSKYELHILRQNSNHDQILEKRKTMILVGVYDPYIEKQAFREDVMDAVAEMVKFLGDDNADQA